MSDDLYHQEILDHYHHPDNYGALKNADFKLLETNASCGDSFTFYVVLNKRSIINDLKFTGQGCAISTAACSLLTSHLKGKLISELKHIDLTFMQNLIGATITPTRLKCLMLPARALIQLIDTDPKSK